MKIKKKREKKRMKVNVIVAGYNLGDKLGIGNEKKIPWRIRSDILHFKTITEYSTVIMGRITWESIPEKFRPLSNRQNIIVSKDYCHSLKEALDLAENEKIFIIGGEQLYDEIIDSFSDLINEVYVTIVKNVKDTNFDTYFPISKYEKLFTNKILIAEDKDCEFFILKK